jgi:excisionase family DNA binding protein
MTTAVAREDSWVSIADAAEQLGIHPRTLRRYIRDGRLQVMRLSAQVVRITPEALQDFRDDNIKIQTGTGTCYVPRAEDPSSGPTGAVPQGRVSARMRPERLTSTSHGSGRA